MAKYGRSRLSDRSADLFKAVSTQVDPHPFRMVFNTHWRLGHVGCNETLGKTGAKIVAHANSKKWHGRMVTMEALNRDVAAAEPARDFDSRFNKGAKPDQFLQIAYAGLLRHYAQ